MTVPTTTEAPSPAGRRTAESDHSAHRAAAFHPDTAIWTIRSAIPGRARLHCSALQKDVALARGIESTAGKIQGIHKVQASATTGSVLLEYDRSAMNLESLIELMRHMRRSHARGHRSLEQSEINALHTTAQKLEVVDCRIKAATRGILGLRKSVLLIVGAQAGWNIVTAEGVISETLREAFTLFMIWIMYRHPRIERELERCEDLLPIGL